jgi:hypothetical protein
MQLTKNLANNPQSVGEPCPTALWKCGVIRCVPYSPPFRYVMQHIGHRIDVLADISSLAYQCATKYTAH